MNIIKSAIAQNLPAQPITSQSFAAYGQVIVPTDDSKLFDETDAQLDIAKGIPRFYIMRLQHRGLEFQHITRHIQCTQCLGALEGKDWLLAVAPPNIPATQPELSELQAFYVPGNCFIKLHLGTWHAGPYFASDFVDFYNLELSDTNISDRFTYELPNPYLISLGN